jgi:DNA-binding MarR family transcriptional regulator
VASAEITDGTILWLMKRAFSLQRRTVEEAMRAHGVSAAQAGVLTQLLDAPGLSSSDLARRLVITAQAVTIAVATLEDNGLVERVADPSHGRIRRCFLTKAGRRVAERCVADGIEVEQKLLALLDAEQRSNLAELLLLLLREQPPEPPKFSGGTRVRG